MSPLSGREAAALRAWAATWSDARLIREIIIDRSPTATPLLREIARSRPAAAPAPEPRPEVRRHV